MPICIGVFIWELPNRCFLIYFQSTSDNRAAAPTRPKATALSTITESAPGLDDSHQKTLPLPKAFRGVRDSLFMAADEHDYEDEEEDNGAAFLRNRAGGGTRYGLSNTSDIVMDSESRLFPLTP